MSDLGVNDAFLTGLDRLEVAYEFDYYGAFCLTDAFLSGGTVASVSRLCDNYGMELAIVDNVLVARKRGYRGLGVHPNFHFHLNHHPYYHVA